MNYTRLQSAIEARKRAADGSALPIRELFAPAKTLGGKTANETRMAMDKALDTGGYYDLLTDYVRAIDIDGGRNIAFMGYAALSLLEQNPIIRIIVETLSREATRKWVELKGGEKEDEKRIEAINEALDKYNIRGVFRDCAETAGFQGGCMLYIDTGELTPEELEAPLILKPQTVGKGKLKGFRKIEPMTIYPAPYNAHEPLKADYFDPTHYYVFGRKVHKTRLLKFTSNDLNIMLKPAYNFFGIPLSQLVLRYVQNFENSRDNAAKIVDNFSLWGLKTNMDQMLQGETADDVTKRLKTMLDVGLNFGIALVDKEAEEFFQITMPISGLEGLVAQQLELVALISSIPVTKLFGTPPKGFNATGESDVQNFYDRVKNWQERLFYKNFEKVRRVIELSEFGETYDDVVNEWLPLREPTPKETAEIQLIKAQRDAALLQAGALSAEDIRTRLSQDMTSDYANIDPSDLPKAPEPEGYEEEPPEDDEDGKDEGKAEDEEPAKWITVNGKHIPVDKDGNPMNETGEKTLGKGESPHETETIRKAKELDLWSSREAKKYVKAKARFDKLWKDLDNLRDEWITKASVKGQRGKMDAFYKPKYDELLKEIGRANRDVDAHYLPLKKSIEERWGRTTMNAPGWGKFFASEIQKYIDMPEEAEDEFNESDHPRDDDGKFGEGSGSSGSGETSSGTGQTKEIDKNLIPIDKYLTEHGTAEGADKYLKENFQGKHVTDKDGVKVLFSNHGNKKITHEITGEKAKALPHMPDIIRTGEKTKEELYKERTDYSEMVKYSKEIEKGKKYALKAGKLKIKDVNQSLRAYSFKKETEDEKSDSIVGTNFKPPNTEPLSYDESIPEIWEIVNINVEEI